MVHLPPMKKVTIVVAIILPLVPAAEWVISLVRDVSELAAPGDVSLPLSLALVYYPARIFALTGFALMFYQFLLSARLPGLEKLFPRAALMKRHRSLGKAGFLLILLHGLLLLVFDLIDSGAIIFTWEKLLGIVALFLLIIAVVAAWHFKALQFSLKTWRRFHIAAYFAFPLAFVHAIHLGTVAGAFGPTQILFSLFLLVYLLVGVRRIVTVVKQRPDASSIAPPP